MGMAIATLLTDFGTRDFFVGSVKGALLRECPDCRIVDISHEVPPFDVRRAAFILWASWRAFPAGTAHLAVVDPGVGTSRAFLHMEREGRHFFAPDNGLLTYVLHGCAALNKIVFPPEAEAQASCTFHARDLFAPCVGRFLKGAKPAQASISAWALLPYTQPIKRADGSALGRVMDADRFGNLITDLPVEWLEWGRGTVSIAGRALGVWARAYDELPTREPGMVQGSIATLEIAVCRGSAADVLGVGAGEAVEYRP